MNRNTSILLFAGYLASSVLGQGSNDPMVVTHTGGWQRVAAPLPVDGEPMPCQQSVNGNPIGSGVLDGVVFSTYYKADVRGSAVDSSWGEHVAKMCLDLDGYMREEWEYVGSRISEVEESIRFVGSAWAVAPNSEGGATVSACLEYVSTTTQHMLTVDDVGTASDEDINVSISHVFKWKWAGLGAGFSTTFGTAGMPVAKDYDSPAGGYARGLLQWQREQKVTAGLSLYANGIWPGEGEASGRLYIVIGGNIALREL